MDPLRRPVGRLERHLRTQRLPRPPRAALGSRNRCDRPQGRQRTGRPTTFARILEENWAELGPKLKGKLHIWVGEADDYFLNNAVHQLDNFLSHARPAYEGSITYGPGQGHCWMGISQAAMMKQMAQRMAAPSPTSTHASPIKRIIHDAQVSSDRRADFRCAVPLFTAILLAITFLGPTTTRPCARRRSNFDESKVGTDTLPDPLLSSNGRKVITAPSG